MSLVTNVILSFHLLEARSESPDGEYRYALMYPLNAWLTEQGYGPFGPDADRVAGGTKHLETPLYVAAFNYLDVDAFMARLRTLPWEYPSAVQVFLQTQEENTFRLMAI